MAYPKVKVGVEILTDDDGEILLDELISRLVQARLDIPEEHRASAVFHLGIGDHTAYIEVRYERAPTAEEKRRAYWSEVQERQELARLMYKYGWPPPERIGS